MIPPEIPPIIPLSIEVLESELLTEPRTAPIVINIQVMLPCLKYFLTILRFNTSESLPLSSVSLCQNPHHFDYVVMVIHYDFLVHSH